MRSHYIDYTTLTFPYHRMGLITFPGITNSPKYISERQRCANEIAHVYLLAEPVLKFAVDPRFVRQSSILTKNTSPGGLSFRAQTFKQKVPMATVDREKIAGKLNYVELKMRFYRVVLCSNKMLRQEMKLPEVASGHE